MDYLKRVDFSAKFEPKGNYILHGNGQYDVFERFNSFDSYRASLKETAPILSLIYIGLFDYIRYDMFANIIKDHIDSYSNSFIIPLICLDFTKDQLPGSNYEKEVAEGLKDNELRTFFNAIKTIKRPIFLVPGNGCNGEWNNYDPENYKKAFVRVYEIMNQVRCDNVSLVWTMNPAAKEKNFMKFYPGDNYVDWWGLEIYQTPEESASCTFSFISEAEKRSKPVMIDSATPFRYGATNLGWERWFASYFNFIKENPVIKAVCYINRDWTKYPKWSGWGDSRLESNSTILNLYEKELQNKVWLNDNDKNLVETLVGYKE